MSSKGEVRFENRLNLLHSVFTAKTLSRDQSLPWNEAFYKEWAEEFQVFYGVEISHFRCKIEQEPYSDPKVC